MGPISIAATPVRGQTGKKTQGAEDRAWWNTSETDTKARRPTPFKALCFNRAKARKLQRQGHQPGWLSDSPQLSAIKPRNGAWKRGLGVGRRCGYPALTLHSRLGGCALNKRSPSYFLSSHRTTNPAPHYGCQPLRSAFQNKTPVFLTHLSACQGQ